MDQPQTDPEGGHEPPGETVVQPPSMTLRVVAGDRIGAFKVLEQLGEGGFGAVYLCDQKEPVRRRVAVKIIKAGMDTADVVTRFEAERQAMAMMDHPAIAKVFEAGATPEGRPYFAMEYVKGVPITEYCDQHKLDMSARLGLFAKVCHAVQHAHQRGVIHRDLKPGNILVSIDGGREPQPKIIDFGIAKATSQRLTERTLHTQMGQMMGTILYMSPEQAGTSGEDIDTRSDVYSLGVVLYQLICGKLPFEAEALREKGYFEMQRVIREEDPPRPSTRIATAGAQAEQDTTQIATDRRTSIGALAGALRNELEWIPLKALRKDRTERYSTAEALADDLERYLKGEALEAGPESASYRFKKFMRRHRGAVAAAGLVSLSLVAGLIGTTVFAFQAREQARIATEQRQEAQTQRTLAERKTAEAEQQRQQAQTQQALAERKTAEAEAAAVALEEQRDEARLAAERAAATSEFLSSVLAGIDPTVARSRDTALLEEILASAAQRVDFEFEGDPSVEAEIRNSIANAYEAIFRFESALEQLARIQELDEEVFGPDDPETLSVFLDIGRVQSKMGRHEQALASWGEAARRLEETQGPVFILTRLATSYHTDALIELGRVDEAIKIRRRILEDITQALGPEAEEVVWARINLASGLSRVDRDEEAAGIYHEHWRALASSLGEHDPQTLDVRNSWIGCLADSGQQEEALAQYRELLVLFEQIYPEDHPKIANGLFHISSLLDDLGRYEQVLGPIARARDLFVKIYGPHYPGSLAAGRIQFVARLRLEHYEAAAEVGEQVLAHHMESQFYGPGHPLTGVVAAYLADVHRDWNEAEPSIIRAFLAEEHAAFYADWQREHGDGGDD